MSIHAKYFKNNNEQSKLLDREIFNIIAIVDDELKIAFEQGKHAIYVPVPITFLIPNMKNAIAQKRVYYGVLSILLKNEYIAEIIIKAQAAIFCISWCSKEERDEMEKQNILLAKHTRRDPVDQKI